MGVILLISLALLPFLLPPDPGPHLGRTITESRQIECEWVSHGAGMREYPGQIMPSRPRGDYLDRSAVICREPLMRPGLRAQRDEAILATLAARAAELAITVESLRPDLADRTWLVEAYYPSAPVEGKISFATKNALIDRGLRVSDRTPTLAVGDVGVITRMSPSEAYPAACQRYFATGSLTEDDALLAVLIRDPRETILHAGLCARGQWAWLR